MNVVLFDDSFREHLKPLTYTRPCADLRIGILTIAEKWTRALSTEVSYKTAQYLQTKFPLKEDSDSLHINGRLLPDSGLVQKILELKNGEMLVSGELELAYVGNAEAKVIYNDKVRMVNSTSDLFAMAGEEIVRDFEDMTKGRKGQTISSTNSILDDYEIFVESGAVVECSVLNASAGPIYIGKHAEIMEGSMIRGPFALGERSVVKMGAKIYSNTSIGPWCKVGGELNNVVFQGFSNKGHDGFLGNSFVGEWCNIGADSNNSNLKNNYDEVKMWNYAEGRFTKTGLQFCGLVMGDHSKCGINTMFNTGTTIGVSANIFGSGFPRNFIPSFNWGGSAGFSTYQLDKALQTATLVMKRRGKQLDDIERSILEHIFEETKIFRA